MNRNSSSAHWAAVAVSLCGLTGGCAHSPAAPSLQQAGAPGYRFAEAVHRDQSDDLLVVLGISGGGGG